MKNSIFFSVLGFQVLLCLNVHAQQIQSMDFKNKPIADILLVLAEASKTSIIPDETVTGSASFHFSNSELDDALDLFLTTYKLHYTRSGNIIKVSRIASSFDKEANTVVLKADDVPIESLIRALSRSISMTILYDPLPATNISVDIDNLPPNTALEILSKRIPEYSIETKDSYIYVRRSAAGESRNAEDKSETITENSGSYSLNVEKSRFLDVLAELFKKGGKEYSLMTRTDLQLENLYFSNRDFDSLLRLLLEQGNADYVIHNGIYYILELDRKDVVKKLKKTQVVQLSYVSVQELPSLLPSDLASSFAMKPDKNTNSVVLTGSDEETRPLLDFIALIDKPLDGLKYRRFALKYLKVKDFISVIPQKLIPIAPVAIPDSNSFIVLGSTATFASIDDFISLIDRKSEGYPVKLAYIKTEDFMKLLPPSISKEDIVDSGYPNLLFFTGSEDKRKIFLKELSLIDKPKPQIRYELLVIQYVKNENSDIGGSVSITSSPDSSKAIISANMSSLMNLNFNVISQFGYQFATELSVEMQDKLAEVFADTTLNGLSGQELKFQNTDTYRYQEFEYDDDTGKVTDTGVTREITSGLIVSLNGWVSGDNMITMAVNATVSKQNSESSSSSTALPSTSERIVTTNVRTPSGKPVIIGGLMQEDMSTDVKKVPGLGDIPLLGYFFKSEVKSKKKTEIVIYIVPYIMKDETYLNSPSARIEHLYRSFFQTESK